MVVVPEEVKHIRKGVTNGSLCPLPPPSGSTVIGLLQLNENAVVGEDEKRQGQDQGADLKKIYDACISPL